MRLAGQVALVAGGSGGIGRAISLALAREGATVAIAARGRAGLEGVVAEVEAAGGRAFPVVADVADEHEATGAVEAVTSRCQRLDVLVTAQGTGRFGPVDGSELGDWDAMIRANLRGTYLACRAALVPMLEQGRGTIVNIISLAAVRTIPGCAGYAASKAGALGFTRVLAEEVRGRGIRVTAICPGAVDTPFWDTIPSPPDRSRMLRPETVAEAVVLAVAQPAGAMLEEIVLAPTPGVL